MLGKLFSGANQDLRDIERDFDNISRRLGLKKGWTPFFYRSWKSGHQGETSHEHFGPKSAKGVKIRLELYETPAEYHCIVEVPGLKKEDIMVENENGALLIKGEIKNLHHEKMERLHRQERQFGTFTRRLQMPENSKLDETQALVENGLLFLTIPKKVVTAPATAKTIPIQ